MRRSPLRLGVLGGTLDPVHAGHVAAAHAAARALSLDAVWLMPSHVPAHKGSPHASPWHRFAMTALAASEDALLVASDLELARPGPTYTWDTLQALAAEGFAASQIFFITGADAFAGIDTWHRFPDVLDAGHFVVVTRPGHALPPDVLAQPDVAQRLRIAGDTATDSSPASTDSRAIWLVEADTPDVSSTDIRQRILAGKEAGTDVPASVAAHIRRHGLYTHQPAARRLHGED
ncbi:putative nicotinate-nucleotide adenylyltransferase [Luteitalea pratensis]|uniref:Probable nicotinate-nucleotide adenylyltransferase n=1 Tax=Luteitalea pratensis TaxID=1855912 RepID=A0A143PUG3_LUTPR|nr:nicotinate-nucleotide adenylyltransferase [Luteitalea pratensis]AMY12222.1 putative nicotinate-nucleotide adenylyltransferase [Luteitalea pratensis]